MPLVEGSATDEKESMLAILRRLIFSRLPELHLPLLWEPDALEFIPFTLANTNNVDYGEIEGLEPINPLENFYFPGFELEFPEGDVDTGWSDLTLK